MSSTSEGTVALIILDGWGISREIKGNAVLAANTPFIDSLFAAYPHTEITCHGQAVGLPEGQMGNSEVGHLNLGAGRVVHQDISRIDQAIAGGSLKDNPALKQAIQAVLDNQSTLHLVGLVSDGGVHSSMKHLFALIKLACEAGVPRLALHAHLDGRDTPPDSGAGYLHQVQRFMEAYPRACIATVGGRYWGMDRDKRWDRVKKSWQAMVEGQGPDLGDAVEYVRSRYDSGETDEFITPAVARDEPGRVLAPIRDGDGVVFFNFRADRARELTWAFNLPDFDGFDAQSRPKLASYVTMTRYDENLDLPAAFPPLVIKNTLAEVISRAGIKQLHIAETEKYAHVTFFFNGGVEEPFEGEDRVLVPSPSEVATYDQKPAMSANEVTNGALDHLARNQYGFMVMNFANGDMVGHTGDYYAALKAMETVDACLSRLVPYLLDKGGRILLTADHGNAEQMVDPISGGPYTAHTVSNPVPLILVDQERQDALLRPGALCDVAPSVLALMGLPQPSEMTGKPLFTLTGRG
jgi:2,3-bisphosphoglycerate-independent phosphoglycerate mutase